MRVEALIAALMVVSPVGLAVAHAGDVASDAKSAGPEATSGFPAPAKGPIPAGDPGSWVRPADYPHESLMKGVQGLVPFVLDVDSAGRVSDCNVTQSSGTLELDQATCRLISERALFLPARDAKGVAMPGRYRSRVNWVVPSMPPPPPGSVVTSAIVQADGTVTDCFMEISGDVALTPGAPKSGPCPSPRTYSTGYVDATGRPVARRVVNTQKNEVFPIEDTGHDVQVAVPGKKPVAQ